jgi:hypothetical protein
MKIHQRITSCTQEKKPTVKPTMTPLIELDFSKANFTQWSIEVQKDRR